MGEELPGLAGIACMNVRERGAVLALIGDGASVLEIGTADGATASWLATQRPGAAFLSVDTFPAGQIEGILGSLPNWELNRQPNMNLWVGPASRLTEFMGPALFDLTIIDGEHTLESVLLDLRAAKVLTRPAGVIVMHDYEHRQNGVKPAVEQEGSPWVVQEVVGSMAILRQHADAEMMERLKELGYA